MATRGAQSDATGLWAAYQGEQSTANRNALVMAYVQLVDIAAVKLKNTMPWHVDIGDMKTAGALGLISAVERYDQDAGVAFATYAMHRIRGSMLDGLRNDDWVPRQVRARVKQVATFITNYFRRYGGAINTTEALTMMGISEQQFRQWQKDVDVHTVFSFDAALLSGDQQSERLDMLRDAGAVDPAEAAVESDDLVKTLLAALDARQRAIFEMYYFANLSMRDIGRALRLSESRVCQIHKAAIGLLRSKFIEED